MASTTLSKEMIKVDDENFEIKEVRETVTNINYKIVFNQMASFKKDITNKVQARKQELQVLKNAIDTYNLSLVDMRKAKEEFGYDYELPEEISLESIEASLETNE